MSQSRVQPHNDEAEIATLGAILIDPESIDEVVTLLQVEDFYRKKHAYIYDAICHLDKTRTNIDYVTLAERLKQLDQLEAIGGMPFLFSLSEAVPSSANVVEYAEIVREHSLRRRLIKISTEIIEESYVEHNETSGILEEAERKVFDIAERKYAVSYRSIQNDVFNIYNRIEGRRNEGGESNITGIPSGFEDMDTMLGGFQNAEFIVIGARPSVGKTALALSITMHTAVRNQHPIGFFSLEMSGDALIQRLLSMESRVSGQKIRSGRLSLRELQQIQTAAQTIYPAPLWIADEPGMKLLDIRAQVRRMKRKHGIEMAIIDYISLIGTEQIDLPRYEQIAELSRSLKALAREIDIPIIALSQLTRDSEGKRPVLANIRESGSIEQDADVVIFLHREREATNSEAQIQAIKTELIVAKQRNGPVGSLQVVFIPQYTAFESYMPEFSHTASSPV